MCFGEISWRKMNAGLSRGLCFLDTVNDIVSFIEKETAQTDKLIRKRILNDHRLWNMPSFHLNVNTKAYFAVHFYPL